MNASWLAYLVVLSTAVITGFVRWIKLPFPERTICILLGVTAVNEFAAFFGSYYYHNSFPVYHLFSPVEIFLISLYFNQSVDLLRRHNIGIWVGAVSIVASVLNTLFLQKLTTINSNFLLLEGTVVIIYGLLSLRQILLDEDRLPYAFALFWFSLCFLVYWGSTFMGWGVYAILNQEKTVLGSLFNKVLVTANFIFYAGIATIFLFFKKLIHSSGK